MLDRSKLHSRLKDISRGIQATLMFRERDWVAARNIEPLVEEVAGLVKETGRTISGRTVPMLRSVGDTLEMATHEPGLAAHYLRAARIRIEVHLRG